MYPLQASPLLPRHGASTGEGACQYGGGAANMYTHTHTHRQEDIIGGQVARTRMKKVWVAKAENATSKT
jgi:hypothetical protein